jgi:hypothetical protein
MGLLKLSPIEREIGDASQQDEYLQIPNVPRLLQPPRECAQIHSSKSRVLFESFECGLDFRLPLYRTKDSSVFCGQPEMVC